MLFQDQSVGKDIITQEDFEKIQAMYDALYSTPFVAKLLSGEKELSFFTEDDRTGLIVKCRPDCLTTIGEANILIDYKSCADASSEGFMKDAIKLNYDLQMAYYKDIVDEAREKEHIIEGLVIALASIDEVIAIIRRSKTIPESKEALSERFGLDDIQTTAIVQMQLGKLAGLEKQKILDELQEKIEMGSTCPKCVKNRYLISILSEIKKLYKD